MEKYTCKTTKNEIINAIIEEFEKVNAEYSKSLENNDAMLERNFGKYIAMIELLEKVKIFTKSTDE